MRVISGRFKGFQLPQAKPGTRPTTDRTKEAVFSRLDALGVLEGARVLDLFAGTGALGIEALSRGADELLAVEYAGAAASVLSGTLKDLQRQRAWSPDMHAQVMCKRAERMVSGYQGRPFDVVFADPPYSLATEECNSLLERLVGGEATDEGTVMIVERSTRSEPLTVPEGWEAADRRDYGETAVTTICSAER